MVVALTFIVRVNMICADQPMMYRFNVVGLGILTALMLCVGYEDWQQQQEQRVSYDRETQKTNQV